MNERNHRSWAPEYAAGGLQIQRRCIKHNAASGPAGRTRWETSGDRRREESAAPGRVVWVLKLELFLIHLERKEKNQTSLPGRRPLLAKEDFGHVSYVCAKAVNTSECSAGPWPGTGRSEGWLCKEALAPRPFYGCVPPSLLPFRTSPFGTPDPQPPSWGR